MFAATFDELRKDQEWLTATTGNQRAASLPETPTMAESGYPGAGMLIWYGIVAPGATPKDVIARLHAEINKAMKLPDVRERWTALGAGCFE